MSWHLPATLQVNYCTLLLSSMADTLAPDRAYWSKCASRA